MASSTHWLASQSAMAVLEDGGNACDAAVAAGFVLHVVEPHLNGPAGEVPAASAGREAQVIDGLRRRGHLVTVGEAWSEGRLCAVARDPETGVLSAAANPRGMQGYAVGR